MEINVPESTKYSQRRSTLKSSHSESLPDKLIAFIPCADSLKENFEFHPTTTPRGTEYYDGFVLNSKQQKNLNVLKADIARENNKYLAEHPEIRALVAIFTKSILRKSLYMTDIGTEAMKFFSRPRRDIEYEVIEYLQERKKRVTRKTIVIPDSKSSEPETSTPSGQPSEFFSFDTYTDNYVSPEHSCTCSFVTISDKDLIINDVLDYLIFVATQEKYHHVGYEEYEEYVYPNIYKYDISVEAETQSFLSSSDTTKVSETETQSLLSPSVTTKISGFTSTVVDDSTVVTNTFSSDVSYVGTTVSEMTPEPNAYETYEEYDEELK